MAIIGVRGLKIATYDEKTGKHSDKIDVSDTIDVDIKINSNDTKLYADDQLVESDNTFKDGDIAVQVADIEDETRAKMLGHKYTEGETVYNKDDAAPYLGVGFYATRKVHGVVKFRAVVFLKAKFSEPSEKFSTKGDNISFQTPTINGKISTDKNGNWKKDKTFATETEAIEYIDNILNGTEVVAAASEITSNES